MSNTGVKISGEHVINGASGEPMGGMSGSYSQLASLPGGTQYAFAWNSRGCIDLTANTWMGTGYTNCKNRTNNRNVAMAMFTDKETKVGPQASATVGAAVGDSQVNWLTTGSTADMSNVHLEAFADGKNMLVTWEEIAQPTCNFEAMGCSGAFTGSYFLQVDSTGNGTKVGEPISSQNVYVAGDIVRMPSGSLCWPYVNMTWDLSKPVGNGAGATTTKMSFACMAAPGAGNSTGAAATTTVSANATSPAATSAAAEAEGDDGADDGAGDDECAQ